MPIRQFGPELSLVRVYFFSIGQRVHRSPTAMLQIFVFIIIRITHTKDSQSH